MENNIPPELKEVFEQILVSQFEADSQYPLHVCISLSADEDAFYQAMHSAYTLGQQGRENEIAELKRQIQTQAKHKDSIKGYWLSCSEAKKKWTDAIQEYFDSEHPESIQSFEDFKEQFDLD